MSSSRNYGARMQSEFNRNASKGPAVNYSTPKTAGQIQDDLRREEAKENNGDAHQPY